MNRYDLTRVTFLLVVKYDSLERIRNLKVALRFLLGTCDTHIHVLEVGAKPACREQLVEELPAIRYDFEQDETPFFYKTRLLNRLLGTCDTPFVAVHDVDILCHPANIHRAVRFLEDGRDIALPYSGLCLDVPGPLIPRLLGPPKDFPGRKECGVLYTDATGGLVFFRTESLLAAGGYNEYFKSWGHEDREVLHRMLGLGARLEVVHGHIYHMRHPRHGDSHPQKNPYYAANCREYERVKAMDPAALRRYAAAFPWRHRADDAD